ncbi:hypothetical protein VTN96DRAFT_2791 [Rasamsonia emersonii]
MTDRISNQRTALLAELGLMWVMSPFLQQVSQVTCKDAARLPLPQCSAIIWRVADESLPWAAETWLGARLGGGAEGGGWPASLAGLIALARVGLAYLHPASPVLPSFHHLRCSCLPKPSCPSVLAVRNTYLAVSCSFFPTLCRSLPGLSSLLIVQSAFGHILFSPAPYCT